MFKKVKHYMRAVGLMVSALLMQVYAFADGVIPILKSSESVIVRDPFGSLLHGLEQIVIDIGLLALLVFVIWICYKIWRSQWS